MRSAVNTTKATIAVVGIQSLRMRPLSTMTDMEGEISTTRKRLWCGTTGTAATVTAGMNTGMITEMIVSWTMPHGGLGTRYTYIPHACLEHLLIAVVQVQEVEDFPEDAARWTGNKVCYIFAVLIDHMLIVVM